MPRAPRSAADSDHETSKMLSPEWRVHTQRIFAEVLQNKSCDILRQPLTIMDNLMRQVASRASDLNDPELNRLMLRLTLYAIADPYSPDFDPRRVESLLNPQSEGCN